MSNALTTVTKVIPAYVYQEYSDDSDVQAFFAAYNGMAQQYVDWFNALNLPVYTGAPIIGALLDWVGQGLYGITRPVLTTGHGRLQGPLNTYTPNQLSLNRRRIKGGGTFYTVTDDIYKRVLTWHLYKGDGKIFSVFWLKRRILRFLVGVNGTDTPLGMIPSAQSISVTFGAGHAVHITLPLLNPISMIFQNAVSSGAIELPFQFTYTITLA